jgi:hypothetical protein
MTAPATSPSDAEAAPRGPNHRRRKILLIVLGVVLVAVAVGVIDFARRWGDRGAEQASIDKTVESFRKGQGDDVDAQSKLLPRAGVYVYAGEGREHLSFLSTSQPQGPELPGTIVHEGDGCWSFAVSYNEYHSQTWNYCARDGKLYDEGGVTKQKFDFVATSASSTSTFVCDPPALVLDPKAEPGASERQSCTGTTEPMDATTTDAGTGTYVGRETIEVDGEDVETHHYRVVRTLNGDQTGNSRSDWWFRVTDALPVRNTREIEVRSPSPIGDVTYTEEGSFTLSSLAPRR